MGDRECPVCGGPRADFGTALVLGKYQVEYLRCARCGLVQSESPYWLDEAYSSAIAASDIGLIGRNLRMAQTATAIINAFFDPAGRFLDFGGGYGMLVRLMRDKGFDFYRDDPLCENVFAPGFDRSDDGPFELVTAFEVFEHLPNPVTDAGRMLELSGSVLFSTLVAQPIPSPGDWWYYALDTGQHVSFYTPAALTAIADQLGARVVSSRANDIHLLTNNSRALRWFRFASRPKNIKVLSAFRERGSLLATDYERMTGRRLE